MQQESEGTAHRSAESPHAPRCASVAVVPSARLPLLLLLLFACACLPLARGAPLRVEVAVLVFGQEESQPGGDWPSFLHSSEWGPPTLAHYDTANLGFMIYNAYYQGLAMWVEPMLARPSPNLPFPGGGGADLSVRWVNLASANWSSPAGFYSSLSRVQEENLVRENGTLVRDSMLWNLTDPARFQQFGASVPFTFVVIPPALPDAVKIAMANRVEDARSLILLDSFGANVEAFVCSDPALAAQYPHAQMDTPDCRTRNRLPGQRRFQTLFSMLQDATQCAVSAFDVFHTLGVRRVAVLAGGPSPADTFPFYASHAILENADSLGMDAISFLTHAECEGAPVRCSHTWASNLTSAQVAKQIRDYDADVVLFVANSRSRAAPRLAEVMASFKSIDFTPKAVYFAGGFETAAAGLMPHALHTLDFISLTWPWFHRLRGPNYRSIRSDVNFELYSARPQADSPMVWHEAYMARGNPHAVTEVMGILGYAALNAAQKMVELARSSAVSTLLATAAAMQEPSPYGLINFDPTGRWSNKYQVMFQRGRLADGPGELDWPTHVAYPFNIAEPLIYPMPTWAERIPSNPASYNRFSASNRIKDNAIVGVNTVAVVFALAVLLLIVVHRDTPVMRASTPWFCALNVVGCILMLLANYSHLTTVRSTMCQLQVWLFTLGFDITYGSLFFKTFRIWRIVGRQKLRPSKMRDGDLLALLALLLSLDILLNGLWQGLYGMNAILVQPDPLRPALNYNRCDYGSEAMAFIWAHIACKATLLFFGMLLGYAVRNVPSAFNEASFIALSIYHVSIVSALVVPILSMDLSLVTTYSLRAYALMFVVLATLLILFVPKLLRIYSRPKVQPHPPMQTTIISNCIPPMPLVAPAEAADAAEAATAGAAPAAGAAAAACVPAVGGAAAQALPALGSSNVTEGRASLGLQGESVCWSPAPTRLARAPAPTYARRADANANLRHQVLLDAHARQASQHARNMSGGGGMQWALTHDIPVHSTAQHRVHDSLAVSALSTLSIVDAAVAQPVDQLYVSQLEQLQAADPPTAAAAAAACLPGTPDVEWSRPEPTISNDMPFSHLSTTKTSNP